MQKPSQGDPTNPTTPTPKPQNHDPRTSQQNQPTTPPPKQQPGKPYQHKPDHTTQPTPAETTTTTNDHSNSQPHNRTRRSLNTHHTNVKSCPQQPHQRNHQNSHQPHTHKREAENTHYTPPPPTQTHTHQPPEALVWHASAGTQNRPGTAQLAAPGRIMIRTGQRVRAPTVFFPRRTRATRPHRKSSSVRR